MITDYFGNELKIGDAVLAAGTFKMYQGTITSLSGNINSHSDNKILVLTNSHSCQSLLFSPDEICKILKNSVNTTLFILLHNYIS